MRLVSPVAGVVQPRRKAILRSFAAALNSQTVRIAGAIIMTLVTIAFLGLSHGGGSSRHGRPTNSADRNLTRLN